MSARFDFPIILLAAGASRRMQGCDKLLELVDGVPLLRRQAGIARQVTKAQVIVALPPAPHPRYDVLNGIDVLAVPVPDAAEGMNASLRAGFAALPCGAPHAMLLLADMPDLTADDLLVVAQSIAAHPDALVWRGATHQGAPGHPIIFHNSLFDKFAALTGDEGGREVAQSVKDRTILVPLGDAARLDLDTPDAWAAWRKARQTSTP